MWLAHVSPGRGTVAGHFSPFTMVLTGGGGSLTTGTVGGITAEL